MNPVTKGLNRVQPPIRRVLALDAGHRRLKWLLAESGFGRLRLLKQEMLDLQDEGLVSADELKAHLQSALEQTGHPPVALVLPQHLSISQVIDLPQAEESEVEKLIADETIKLSGVTESRIVYDFVRTETSARNRQQFWVTRCQEADIRERLTRLGIGQEDICEVTTTANALIAAYRLTCPLASRTILVHLGAQSTVVVIMLAGQGAFASSFPMGGDFFTRSLARQWHCAEDAAELRKRGQNLLSGEDAVPDYAAAVEGWAAELKRQIGEWFRENPAAAAESAAFELIATGGGFAQPGLIGFLRARAGLDFHPWPQAAQPETVCPAPGFEAAFGVAVQALGCSAQPVSLLPEDYRAAWQKRLGRQRIELASLALVVLCALALVFGTWRKISLIHQKDELLGKVQAGQDALEANEALTADLVQEYERLRPFFADQQQTLDMLKAWGLLRTARSNHPFWFVLVSDQHSYFSRPPALLSTNRPADTNLLAPLVGPSPLFAGAGGRPTAATLTNLFPAKPGLIAEVCIPGDAEAARNVLSKLVNHLKAQPLFARVDLLSEDLRRSLADPKVILPDRHFALALDFAETDFYQPVRLKKVAFASNKGALRRPGLVAPSGFPGGGTSNLPPL